jgi:hypothetical protein
LSTIAALAVPAVATRVRRSTTEVRALKRLKFVFMLGSFMERDAPWKSRARLSGTREREPLASLTHH